MLPDGDTNRTMIPTSGQPLRRSCARCGFEIQPFEPHHTGKDSRAYWCDSCYAKDVDDE